MEKGNLSPFQAPLYQSTSSHCRPFDYLYDSTAINETLRSAVVLCKHEPKLNVVSTGNKAVVCALSASYISTFAGYPVGIFALSYPE